MENNSDIITLPETTRVVTVIGAETYYGMHMIHHLSQKDKMVFGFSQDEDFSFDSEPMVMNGVEKVPYSSAPIISDYLVICIDPKIGFEKYTARIRQICNQCLKEDFCGKIGFFSSGSICLSDCDPITENKFVAPKNELELALATGENILNVLLYNDNSYTSPLILRLGVPYGDEVGVSDPSGFVNRLLNQARRGESFPIHFLSMVKRSVTHISDICESAILLLDSTIAPDVINIPGDILTIEEIAVMISQKYNVTYKNLGITTNSDEDFFVGNQQLSEDYFSQTVKYKRQFNFQNWLAQA